MSWILNYSFIPKDDSGTPAIHSKQWELLESFESCDALSDYMIAQVPEVCLNEYKLTLWETANYLLYGEFSYRLD